MSALQRLSISRTPRSLVRSALATAVLAAGPVLADPVTEWNAFADSLPMGPPPIEARIMTIVQVAVHDALNAIDPRYQSYTSGVNPAPGASAEAAVAAAAYQTLIATVPLQAGAITAEYNLKVSGCLSQACLAGIAAGQAAASAILAQRTNDGSATPHLPYTLAPAPGVYQPTPPTPPASASAPQFAGWAHLQPFVLNSAWQFRADPSPIFTLTSEAYTKDFIEVKRVGAVDAEVKGDRTPDQSAVARFWPAGGANYNAYTRAIVANRGLNEWQHARLFALVNMAASDGAVAVFDTKYTYNFWRPVTAIRAADTDGNPATIADATWLSYQNTPPYPDFTCGLTTLVGATTEVLRRYFGTDDIGYTLTAGGITRSFASLSAATDEAVDARVFGGMHFRTGCVQGVIHGSQVGRFVIQHSLRPLKSH